MNTLSISQIFSNFSFYKENYLVILSDPNQYQTPVAEAYIEVWPFKKEALCLGDLLQLWFAQKWLAKAPIGYHFELFLNAEDDNVDQEKDLYLYAITGNVLTGRNETQAWSVKNKQSKILSIDNVLQNYCTFKACQCSVKPKNSQFKSINSTI
ncbi:MAG: hypothetical protein H9855_14280 [Candidatus Acinetobacter avistercoris]|uniref:hypothetical protein n=1 Tax=Acinetobacter sp. KS-LM10 TaxID=3120518 RepID=UPI001F92A79C|nr:hypothetical protein [Candidatus Acinetobacter avistercoris]